MATSDQIARKLAKAIAQLQPKITLVSNAIVIEQDGVRAEVARVNSELGNNRVMR